MKTFIVASIGLIIIILAIWWQYNNIQEEARHSEYCQNWRVNLAEREAALEERWFPDYDQLNADIAQYNRECAF